VQRYVFFINQQVFGLFFKKMASKGTYILFLPFLPSAFSLTI